MDKGDIKTVSKIILAIIVIIGFLWWKSDNSRLKWIHELQDQIQEQQKQIETLELEVEFWKEEAHR